MKIIWNPSINVINTIKEIKRLNKKGMTLEAIAPKLGLHRTYIHALLRWDKDQRGDKS